ncbi:unnamed protein product [Urochloa humidicola]
MKFELRHPAAAAARPPLHTIAPPPESATAEARAPARTAAAWQHLLLPISRRAQPLQVPREPPRGGLLQRRRGRIRPRRPRIQWLRCQIRAQARQRSPAGRRRQRAGQEVMLRIRRQPLSEQALVEACGRWWCWIRVVVRAQRVCRPNCVCADLAEAWRRQPAQMRHAAVRRWCRQAEARRRSAGPAAARAPAAVRCEAAWQRPGAVRGQRRAAHPRVGPSMADLAGGGAAAQECDGGGAGNDEAE